MEKKQYCVRCEGKEFGPWLVSEVRRLLTESLDPVTSRPRADYEVRDVTQETWLHPSEFDEFYDLYHADSLVPVSTMPDSPRAKVAKGGHGA